jgi:hypothetical protein
MKRKNYKYQKEEFEDDEEDMIIDEDEEVEEEAEDNEESEEHSSDDSEAVIYQNGEEETQRETNEVDENITKGDKDQFNNYLSDIRKNIDELSEKVKLFGDNLESDKAEMGYGISYLDAKNNMMLGYLMELIMYSLMKTTGKDIDESETVRQLITTKTILERSKVIDLKMKSQIDRLIKLAEKKETNEEAANKSIEDENLRVI